MGETRLMLFGGWQLSHAGQVIEVSGRKQKALFTYLAVERNKVHSRESLANIFWGKKPDKQARASLRQCLAGLRSDLRSQSSLIEQTSELGLTFNCGNLQIDAESFAYDPFRETSYHSQPRRAKELTEVMGLFLGLDEHFDAWIETFRSSLCSEALARLQAHYSDQNIEPRARISSARSALVLEPANDEAVRAQMLSNLMLGNSAKALETYDAYYQLLQNELDAEPSIETQDLAVAIKNGEKPTRVDAPVNIFEPKATSKSTLISRPVANATIAVLPFESLGTEPVPKFTLLALLDRICGHLSSLAGPDVISSNSTRQYEGLRPRPHEILSTLNAEYVMAGSISVSAGVASVAAQIAETAGDRIVWASTLAYPAEDVISLRAPIPEDLTKIVSPSVDVAELRRAHEFRDDELAPYQMVLRAREMLFELKPENFQRAGALLRKAVEIGPYFSLGHLRLAEWHSLGLWERRANDADRSALESHAQRAIALKPGNGRAMAFWAHTRFMFEREHDVASQLIDDAVEANPNDSETLAYCIVALAHGGRAKDAVSLADRTLKLSPIDPLIVRNEHFASIAHYSNGDFEKASDLGLSSFRRSANYGSNLRATIAALVAADRTAEAAPLVRQHMQLEPNFSVEAFIPRHGFRDEKDRTTYGKRLVAAGLPK